MMVFRPRTTCVHCFDRGEVQGSGFASHQSLPYFMAVNGVPTPDNPPFVPPENSFNTGARSDASLALSRL